MSGHERPDRIHHLLDHGPPGGFRRGAEDQHGPAVEIIEAGARDLGFEEIRHQPGFDPLQLTSPDGGFDLLEIGVSCAKDHAIDRMLVQHLHQALDRGLVQVHACQDFDLLRRLRVQFHRHPRGFIARADEDHPPPVLRLRQLGARHPAQHLFLGEDEPEADEPEPDDHPHARRAES